MSDNISFISDEEVQAKINIVLGQTDYTAIVAREKLVLFNFDHIKVIRNFLGITEKKAPPIKSLNQEIYRQLRHKLDSTS